MSNRFRKLNMEKMEDRQMMAGDVTAFVSNGNLFLNEAAGQAGLDNAVSIMRLSDSKVRVTGMPTLTDGTISKINGKSFQDFNVGIPFINPNGSLFVNFGGGSDVVVTAPVGGQLKFNQINIDVAAPPIVATRTTSVIPTFTRPDNDTVFLERFQTRGNVSIKTGDGADSVTVLNGLIGNIGATPKNLSINTGAGADFVRVRSTVENTLITGTLDVQTFSSLTEVDRDDVLFEKIGVQGDAHVRTGGGIDTITMTNVGVSHNLDFDAGSGGDTATLDGVSAVDSLMAHLGEGDDTLNTKNLFTKNLTLAGDGGFDRLVKQADPFFTGKRTQSGWELINGIPAGVFDGLLTR